MSEFLSMTCSKCGGDLLRKSDVPPEIPAVCVSCCLKALSGSAGFVAVTREKKKKPKKDAS